MLVVRGLLLAVLLLFAAAGLLAAASSTAGSGEGRLEPYDCNALYRVFVEALRMLVNGSATPEALEEVASATAPGWAAQLHRSLYRELAVLAEVEQRLRRGGLGAGEALELLRRLYEARTRLPGLAEQYMGALYSCAASPEQASAMRMEAKRLLSRLDEMVYQLEGELIRVIHDSQGFNVDLKPRVASRASPLLRVCVAGPPGVPPYTLLFSVRPSRLPVPLGGWVEEPLQPGPAGYCALLRVEPVNATLYVVAYPARVVEAEYILALRLRDGEGRLYGPVLERVRLLLENPVDTVNVPVEVRLGEPLRLRLRLKARALVEARLDGRAVARDVLGPGSAALELEAETSPGMHTLELIVRPLEDGWFASARYTVAVAVVAEAPHAAVAVESPAVDPLNRVTVSVVNRENATLHVEARLEGRVSEADVPPGGRAELAIRAPLNPLPWVYNLTITLTVEGNPSKTITITREVVVVNLLGLAALAALTAAVALLGGDMDLIALLARARPRSAAGGPGRLGAAWETAASYFEALSLRLPPSRLAQAYYSALQSLGIPRPGPSQTLREHWRETVEPILRRLGERLERLRAAMLAAERDLYTATLPRRWGRVGGAEASGASEPPG